MAFFRFCAYTGRESVCFQAQKGVSVYEKSFLYFHAAGYAGKAATQTAAATNMIFSMYITIPVILGVVITILLGLMKVEKENKRIDMERAEKAD